MTEVSEQYIGQMLGGRYEIVSLLGEGGFGLVFKARQLSTGQVVAIKLMQPELLARSGPGSRAQVQIKRFQREMQLIAQLKHPNIVRLIDSGEMDDGQLFTVLEFIEGESLAQVLERDGALTVREAKHLMFQVLDGLSSAHELGIVHRDLKPDNIMLTRTGYRRNAMVLDFGVASVVEELRSADFMSLTSTSEINGTPAYMAPEQVRQQKLTSQTDIYSWGLVFIECLTGKQAVGCNTMIEAALRQASDEDIPVPPVIDHPGLRRIVERAIKKDLKLRYANARELLADLDMCDISNWAIKQHVALMETVPGISAVSPEFGETQTQIPSVSLKTNNNIKAENIVTAEAYGETFDADAQRLPADAREMLARTVPTMDSLDPSQPPIVKINPNLSPSTAPMPHQHQATVAFMEGVAAPQRQSQRMMLVWIVVLGVLIVAMVALVVSR
jgi:serine/threonine protein kinase